MKRGCSLVAAVLLLIALSPIVEGQRGRFRSAIPDKDEIPNSEFVLARWHYTAGWRGDGWGHDYPVAEEHILQIMSETTGLNTSRLSYRVVELSSPEIFKYPFAYISEPGEMLLSDKEIENLREFIERGGFIMIDDFGGQGDEGEFDRFNANLIRAFPDHQLFPLTDAHPLLRNFYDVDSLYMEHPMTRVKSIFYGFADQKGRLAMVICFNNDVGDYWEFIDQPRYLLKPSAEALKLGVHFVMYSMTH